MRALKPCVAGTIVILLLAATFRPVPRFNPDSAYQVTAEVVGIRQSSSYDIFFKLKDVEQPLYINRGAEQGLSVDDLKTTLLGQQVTFRMPRYWSILTMLSGSNHIAQVEYQGELIYDEMTTY